MGDPNMNAIADKPAPQIAETSVSPAPRRQYAERTGAAPGIEHAHPAQIMR